MSSEVKANKVSPATGTAITLGDSGDTFTIPSGATISIEGTVVKMTNLPTSDPTTAGQLWRSGNDLKVSTG